MAQRSNPLDRLMAKVEVDDTSDCWLWTGFVNPDGYGTFWHDRRSRPAHQAAWILHRGPIPDGLVIDHLCRVRRCVNPEHLEPVTNSENLARGAAARTHCIRGHAFTEANTYTNPRTRERACRAWNREANRRYRYRC